MDHCSAFLQAPCIELSVSSSFFTDGANSVTKSGENVLRITKLFAKLSKLLNIRPKCQSQSGEQCYSVEDHCNIFYPGCMAEESDDVDCTNESDTTRTVSTD